MENTGANEFLEKNSLQQFHSTNNPPHNDDTYIDNIVMNSYEHNSNSQSGNITTYISDHLPQFLIIENLK